jgi:exonuclease SbcC
MERFARGGVSVAPTISSEFFDVILRSPCFDAFVSIVDDEASIEDQWMYYQEKVTEYRQEQKSLVRDVYLVLLVSPMNKSLTSAASQKITTDTLFCRKFVVPQVGSIRDALSTLPFLAYEVADSDAINTLDSVVEAIQRNGYPPNIAQIFTQRVAPQRLADILLDSAPPEAVPQFGIETSGSLLRSSTTSARKHAGKYIKSLSIRNFRGIRRLDLDFDCELVAIYGRNGTGKTSIIDAIEWSLLGEVERLSWPSEDDESKRMPYVNLLSEDGNATVAMSLTADGSTRVIERSTSKWGESEGTLDGIRIVDEHQVLDYVIGEYAESMDIRNLRSLVQTSNFLAQSTLKNFLSSTPEERYEALSHFLGTQDYARYLEKLESVIQCFGAQGNLHRTHAKELSDTTTQIDAQIKSRQRVLLEFQTGRQLVRQLQAVLSAVRDKLAALESPIKSAVPSRTENYDDVQTFHRVLEEWVSQASREASRQLNALKQAEAAFKRIPQLQEDLEATRVHLAAASSEIAMLQERAKQCQSRRSVWEFEIASVEREIERRSAEIESLESAVILRTEQDVLARNIRDKRQQIESATTKLQTEQSTLRDLIARQDATRESLQALDGEVERLREVDSRLLRASTLVDEWGAVAKRHGELTRRLHDEKGRLQELRSRGASLQAMLLKGRQEVRTIESTLSALRETLDLRRKLILQLGDLVSEPNCPLCGYSWGNVETLKRKIADQSSWAPPDLLELVPHLEKAKASAEAISSELRECAEQIAILEQQQSSTVADLGELSDVSQRMRKSLQEAGVPEEAPSPGEYVRSIMAEHLARSVDLSKQREGLSSELNALQIASNTMRERVKETSTAAEAIKNGLPAAEQRFRLLSSEIARKSGNVASLDNQKAQEQLDGLHKLRAASAAQKSKLGQLVVQLEAEMSGVARQTLDLEQSLAKHQASQTNTEQVLQQMRDTATAVSPQTSEKTVDFRSRNQQIEQRMILLRELDELAVSVGSLATWLATESEIEKLRIQRVEIQKQNLLTSEQLKKNDAWAHHLRELHTHVQRVRSEVENWRLRRYEPTLNVIYRRLSPHPLFGPIKISVNSETKTLKIQVDVSEQLSDGDSDGKGLAPLRYFSEAQQNILALSLFLSNSIHQRWSHFGPILLDDPVQNMDDLNANALIDSLRTLVNQKRQFVLATCDIDFYRLLVLKLACLNTNGKKSFRAYRLEGSSADGPTRIDDV